MRTHSSAACCAPLLAALLTGPGTLMAEEARGGLERPALPRVLLRSGSLDPATGQLELHSPLARSMPSPIALPWRELGDGTGSQSEVSASEDSALQAALAVYQGEGSVMRRRLEAAGLRVEAYLPEQTWLVRGTRAQLEALLSHSQREAGAELVNLFGYLPVMRVAPEVWEFSLASEQEAGMLIHLFSGTSANRVEGILESLGLSPERSRQSSRLRVGVRGLEADLAEARDRLMALPEVFWLEERGDVRLLNTTAVPIVQNGSPQASRVFFDQGLRGEGQVVGYVDTGLDIDSCFVRDPSGVVPALNTLGGTAISPAHRKIRAYDFLYHGDEPTNPLQFDNHGHGTHVAGNIGGDNLARILEPDDTDGMALAATFVVQDGGFGTDNCADLPGLGCPVVDLIPIFDQAYAQGARIHTNSWGDNENSSSQNNYSAGSEDVDQFMVTHPDFLLIFAGGNSGPGAGTVGSPSTAKNGLSIGGTYNGAAMSTLVSFSSRGPTTDGRFKPDLLAPAYNTSAGSDKDIRTNNCGTDTGGGTSYAAPLAAGAAALVRQYFEAGYYPGGVPSNANGFVPNAALIKAVLMSSGMSISGGLSFPGYDQGWGRIELNAVLPFPGDPERLKVFDGPVAFQASTDAPFQVQVEVADATLPLKVSLVWTDPPSNPAAQVNLVNDLDLSVDGARRTYRGNVFRNGVSVGGGSADRLNNVEQVLLSGHRAGTYTITVRPAAIPMPGQTFALVVRGGLR